MHAINSRSNDAQGSSTGFAQAYGTAPRSASWLAQTQRAWKTRSAIRGVTIASSLQRMLLDVRALGDDLEFTPGGGAGMTVAIADVALSGT